MLLLVAIVSILIAVATVGVTRSLAHPGSLMALIWAVVFTGVFLVRDNYYVPDITPLSLLLFSEIAFVLAAVISGQMFQRVSLATTTRNFRPVLLLALGLCTFILPLYYRTQTAGIHAGFFNPLAQIRQASLAGEAGSGLYNFVILSLAVVAFALVDLLRNPSRGRQGVYLLALAVAMAYAILTGSKNSILNLAISQFVLFALLRPRLQWWALLLMSVSTLALFAVGVYYVNFGGRTAEATNNAVLTTASEYLLGGTLAFTSQFNTVMQFENNQNLMNGLAGLLGIVGIQVGGGSIHYPFLHISDSSITNVYTILFPLAREYTMPGAFVVMALLGVLCAYMYVHTRRSTGWLVFYALLSNAIILSVVSDAFSFGVSLYIKYALIIVAFSFLTRLLTQSRFKFKRYRVRLA